MKARTETYEYTISGLLGTRTELMEEIAITREQLPILSNEIEATDRVLETLGFAATLR